jgi:redox-sensing transcriptional repressor
MMSGDKRISLSVVKRLPRYYRYLSELLEIGVTRISSQELSERMNVTASQIRQDLNNFGCFGQQGYGYNVAPLHDAMGKLMGLNRRYRVIIVGGGNIGRSLVNYEGFRRRGFIFEAVFDVDESLIGGSISGVPVFAAASLEKYLTENGADIAALALPKENAADAAKIIVECGVKGIWNFSHVDLHFPSDIALESVHLTDSLMTLSYRLNHEV